jgi:hypothetical protein
MTASAPTLERTYTVIPNVAVAQQGSLIATNRHLLRLIVTNLLSVSGVTCKYSCNGVTAGSAGDGINHWAADSDIVFEDAGNAHSWFVLGLPSGLGSMELLVEATLGGGGSIAGGDINAYLSLLGFSGGSTTDVPTVGGGDTLLSLTNGPGHLPTGSNYGAHFHVISATDGTSIRVISLKDAAVFAGDPQVNNLILLEKVYDSPAAITNPYGGVWHYNDTMGDLMGTSNMWHQYATFNNPTSGNLSLISAGFGPITGSGMLPADLDSKLQLVPCQAIDVPTYGILGYIPDLWWAVNDGTHLRQAIPSGSSRLFMCFGEITVPWNGTTDLGGGSINAHVSNPVSAGAAPTPPTPGALITQTPTSRWETLKATLSNMLVADVYVMLKASNLRFDIYDPEDGFLPMFGDQSTITQVGDDVQLVILPNGGWWTLTFDIMFIDGTELT